MSKQTHHRCAIHGRQPRSNFYASDLARNRQRCKKCSHAMTLRWWREHPGQRIWKTFVQRAKRRFGEGPLSGISWKTHGQQLLAGMQLDAQLQRLEWEPDATALDLGALRLTTVEKQSVPVALQSVA